MINWTSSTVHQTGRPVLYIKLYIKLYNQGFIIIIIIIINIFFIHNVIKEQHFSLIF